MADEDPNKLPCKLPWWVIEENPLGERQTSSSLEFRMMKALSIAYGALYRISAEGKVCKEFETCDHKPCRSSMNSWVVAEKAVADINRLGKHG